MRSQERRFFFKITFGVLFLFLFLNFITDPIYYIWLAKNYHTYKLESPIMTDLSEFRLKDGSFKTKFLNSQLIFRFSMEPKSDFCAKDFTVLLLVTSRPSAVSQRMAVRKTWGSKPNIPEAKVIFVLGATNNQTENEVVDKENNAFGDILMSDIKDTYRNLTLKSFAAFAWTATKCSRARFVLKTDDDVIILRRNLVSLCARYRNTENVIIGHRISDGHVRRNKQTDEGWYVPHELYKPDMYPPFCSGFAYLLSQDVLPKLLSASKLFNWLPVEDAFFTGVVAHEAKVWRIKDSHFPYRSAANFRAFDSCSSLKYIAVHGFKTPESVAEIWKTYEESSVLPCLNFNL